MERAGFTDVPVAAIEPKWIIVSERPIASGASAGCSLRMSVTRRITQTKIIVINVSRRKADHQA